jgi:hypothetical protein
MPTYTTLDDVKRIVQSSGDKVVRFSDSLVSIQISESSSGRDFAFDRNEVEETTSFKGQRELRFKFNSSSDFDVVEIVEGHNREVLLDSSQSKSSDYTTPDGEITVKSSAWKGTQESGDEATLEWDAHISDDHAEAFIDESEIEIDSTLAGQRVDFLEGSDNRLWTSSSDVPPEISVACSYLAAYYIYTNVYINIYQENGGMSNYSTRWKKKAEKNVMSYADRVNHEVPAASVFPRYIDKVGVEQHGPGLKELKDKFSEYDHDSYTEDIFTADYDIFEHWSNEG